MLQGNQIELMILGILDYLRSFSLAKGEVDNVLYLELDRPEYLEVIVESRFEHCCYWPLVHSCSLRHVTCACLGVYVIYCNFGLQVARSLSHDASTEWLRWTQAAMSDTIWRPILPQLLCMPWWFSVLTGTSSHPNQLDLFSTVPYPNRSI